jgi:hypothetical protein
MFTDRAVVKSCDNASEWPRSIKNCDDAANGRRISSRSFGTPEPCMPDAFPFPTLHVYAQEPDLFSTTIRDNIAYGIPDGRAVTDEEIEAAARLANAHEFVAALPDGYNTHVGERGSRLSGGQKQRVCPGCGPLPACALNAASCVVRMCAVSFVLIVARSPCACAFFHWCLHELMPPPPITYSLPRADCHCPRGRPRAQHV